MDALDALAAECKLTRTQVCELYAGFALLEKNAEGEVALGAMQDLLARVGQGAMVNDRALEAWMAEADRDGSNTLSFFEYVRMDARLSDQLRRG